MQSWKIDVFQANSGPSTWAMCGKSPWVQAGVELSTRHLQLLLSTRFPGKAELWGQQVFSFHHSPLNRSRMIYCKACKGEVTTSEGSLFPCITPDLPKALSLTSFQHHLGRLLVSQLSTQAGKKEAFFHIKFTRKK